MFSSEFMAAVCPVLVRYDIGAKLGTVIDKYEDFHAKIASDTGLRDIVALNEKLASLTSRVGIHELRFLLTRVTRECSNMTDLYVWSHVETQLLSESAQNALVDKGPQLFTCAHYGDPLPATTPLRAVLCDALTYDLARCSDTEMGWFAWRTPQGAPTRDSPRRRELARILQVASPSPATLRATIEGWFGKDFTALFE
jgi:hypothetical protein